MKTSLCKRLPESLLPLLFTVTVQLLLSSLLSFTTIATTVSFLPSLRVETFHSHFGTVCFVSMGGESHAPSSSLEKQFEDFRLQLEETGNLHDRIWKVVMEIESTARLIHANLLLLHQSRPTLGMEICCYYCILFIYFDQFLWSLSFVWLFEKFWDDFEKKNCFDSLFFWSRGLREA